MQNYQRFWRSVVAVLAVLAGLMVPAMTPVAQADSPQVLPSDAKAYGKWSAKWWQWALELPVNGHPFSEDSSFDCAAGQAGHFWFLGAPFISTTPTERTCEIPKGKSVFFGLLNAECSDLEGLGTTEAEQRDCAADLANHILEETLFCYIDDVPCVENFAPYRVQSPQFKFKAPTPWVFGAIGGKGTAVSDGYFLRLTPLPKGVYTLHYGGSIHFSTAEGDPFDFDGSIDITYHLIVD